MARRRGLTAMQQDFAAAYGHLENTHWWFRARRVILRGLIARLDLPAAPRILEIGTGPGTNLYSIYPEDAILKGLEPDPAQAERARSRGAVPVLTAGAEDAERAWEDETFDAVTMFDVLEHIEDDRGTLRIVRRLLAPGGRLLLTVPAYRFLWGPQDVVSGHFRRYTRAELAERVRQAGFVVERATYFNTLLFPAIAAVRLLRKPTATPKSDFELSLGALSGLAHAFFLAEASILRVADFPFGVSIYLSAVARVST